MKVTMVSDFRWLDDYRVAEFEVRQYRAYHKNGVDSEEGLVFVLLEGERIINVKVPLVVEHNTLDRFIVEPSAKGLRVLKGCNGFMIWIGWYFDLHPVEARSFLKNIFTNTKMPVSGLSAYIKDKLMEEKQ